MKNLLPREFRSQTRVRTAAVVACLACLACSSPGNSTTDMIVDRSPVGGRAKSDQPTLTVSLHSPDNVGPFYFQLGDDSLFHTPLESGPIEPESTRVSWGPEEPLQVGKPYYWRVGFMSGGEMHWDTTQTFAGGPPLGAFPNPYCCKWAKTFKQITVGGMVPPARLRILTAAGDPVFATGELLQSSYAWSITNQAGEAAGNGDYRIEVEDGLGYHELKLHIMRPD